MRNLQEPSISSSLFCVVFAATGDQKCSEEAGMIAGEKLLDKSSHIQHTMVSNMQPVVATRIGVSFPVYLGKVCHAIIYVCITVRLYRPSGEFTMILHVKFGGTRNTQTRSKSSFYVICTDKQTDRQTDPIIIHSPSPLCDKGNKDI